MATIDSIIVPLTLCGELLAIAVDGYLSERYPGRTLDEIRASEIIPASERAMATQLISVRQEAGIPDPTIIGARRCELCDRIMAEDETSFDEEVDLCSQCATGLAAQGSPNHGA